MKGDNKNNEK